jgi:hypothetical protein
MAAVTLTVGTPFEPFGNGDSDAHRDRFDAIVPELGPNVRNRRLVALFGPHSP